MAELKPCPFCGRVPKIEDCGDWGYFVICECGIEQSELYKQKCDAVKHWNRRKTEPMMTNLEWLKTLSAEELADWFYDEWLHHLQYRWSSSRGGLIIWLKDRKDEPQTIRCPKCGRTDYIRDMEKDMGVKGSHYKYKCINCNTYIKDEPQTERSE